MAVYVDRLMLHGWIRHGRSVRSCHLFADSLAELHTFADRLGLRQKSHQRPGFPHYDLTSRKRRQAVRAGAVPVVSPSRRYYLPGPRSPEGPRP